MDGSLSWNNHTYQLMTKLSTAGYGIMSAKSFMTQQTLWIIYFSYAHSILIYVIICWGNSYYCDNISKIQKRIIRVITNLRNRDSCCILFKKLNIIPLKSQYIFSLLLLFVVRNRELNQIMIFIVLPIGTLVYWN